MDKEDADLGMKDKDGDSQLERMDKEDADLGMKDEDGDSQILERMDKENADLGILGRVKNKEDPDSEKKMNDENENSEIFDRLKNKKDDRHWKILDRIIEEEDKIPQWQWHDEEVASQHIGILKIWVFIIPSLLVLEKLRNALTVLGIYDVIHLYVVVAHRGYVTGLFWLFSNKAGSRLTRPRDGTMNTHIFNIPICWDAIFFIMPLPLRNLIFFFHDSVQNLPMSIIFFVLQSVHIEIEKDMGEKKMCLKCSKVFKTVEDMVDHIDKCV